MELRWTALAGMCAALVCTPALSLEDDLVRSFAECTGRLSAEMEHAWLTGDGRADQLQNQRDAMASLLVAVTQPEARRETLAYRIDAKLAHATLLSVAYFSADEDAALRASARAQSLVTPCTAMLLS